MSEYLKHTDRVRNSEIDWDFWRNPEGVQIENDPLKFLMLPAEVEMGIAAHLGKQINEHQVETRNFKISPITRAILVSMGGLTWGSWIYDNIKWVNGDNGIDIEFDNIGVSFYKGPGEPLAEPEVVRNFSVGVDEKSVLVVDDLVDLGGTAPFVAKRIKAKGAGWVGLAVAYLKGELPENSGIDRVFSFGVVPKDTWIITSRERVETLKKRVPFWVGHGASYGDCYDNLKDIGYPDWVIVPNLIDVFEKLGLA